MLEKFREPFSGSAIFVNENTPRINAENLTFPRARRSGGAMFARIDGASPEYMALAPHILAARHVSPPNILGELLPIQFKNPTGWPSSPEVPARMDGSFPEWMAKTPSTLR